MSHPQGQKRFLPPFTTFACAFLLLAPLVLAGWPLDTLIVRAPFGDSSVTVLRVPFLLGRDMTASIIHSVQLTPVVDTYRIQEGRLWTWEERIQSHNAGLPSLKPSRGRFLYAPPWMLVQGDARPVDPLYYRVGTEHLGKNVLCVPALPCLNLWEAVPGKRLEFEVVPGNVMSGVTVFL